MRARGFLCFGLVIGAFVAACSSSSAATPAPYDYSYPGAGPTAAAAASAAGGAPYAYPTAAASAVSAAEASANPGSEPMPSAYVAQPEDQIIKTGSISIQVASLDTSISRATDQMHGLGGWLAGSDRTVSTAQELASVTYRVPVARFEDALAAMRTLGVKVLGEHTDSTPVGGQIVDLQARIANLKASEKAIQAIMEKAKTIGEVLTVEQRLAEVQGQIEELSGQLGGLTNQAAYSTLTVVFEVPIPPTPSPSPSPTPTAMATATPIPWSAGDQAGQAAGTLGEVGKSLATALIWLAILILPIALLGVLLVLLLAGAGRLVEPFTRRLLPVTVGRPVTFARPPAAWGQPPVSWGQPPAPQGQAPAPQGQAKPDGPEDPTGTTPQS